MNIAIVTVAYNRIDSLSRLLSSLEHAYYDDHVTLIISVDKSPTNAVETFADEYNWPYGQKVVDKHAQNLGLRAHMMSLGKWFNQYDALIVLEDDVVVAESYYSFAKQAILKYQHCDTIAGISLYSYHVNYQTNLPFCPIRDTHDVYFMKCAMSWGQVWMRDSWYKFYEWYLNHQEFPILKHLPRNICLWGKKSWLKFHIRYCIENNKYFVYPFCSLSTNFSDAGTHNNGISPNVFQVPLQLGTKCKYILPDYDKKVVRYDGFFENISLYEHFNLSEDELCLDLNGKNGNIEGKRYWLTTKQCNYRIVKSYGLNYRPIELNILCNNSGNQIFMYDTFIFQHNKLAINNQSYLYHYYLYNMVSFIKSYGFKHFFNDIFEIVRRRFR